LHGFTEELIKIIKAKTQLAMTGSYLPTVKCNYHDLNKTIQNDSVGKVANDSRYNCCVSKIKTITSLDCASSMPAMLFHFLPLIH